MKRRLSMLALGALLLTAVLVLWFSPSTYSAQDRIAIMAPATHAHWAGTDGMGRDRAVRIALALLIGVAGAATAAVVTTSIAAAVGVLAGLAHRIAGTLLMFLSDAFLSLPWIFLLMMVRSLLPLTASPVVSATTTFLVLAALGWPAAARVIYEGTLHLRASDNLLYGRAAGMRTRQLVRMHVLPKLRGLLLPQFLICVPAFIIAEANLGSLGLGIAEPLPSWGSMLLDLQNSALLAESRWVYLPIAVLCVVLLLLESLALPVGDDA